MLNNIPDDAIVDKIIDSNDETDITTIEFIEKIKEL